MKWMNSSFFINGSKLNRTNRKDYFLASFW